MSRSFTTGGCLCELISVCPRLSSQTDTNKDPSSGETCWRRLELLGKLLISETPDWKSQLTCL